MLLEPAPDLGCLLPQYKSSCLCVIGGWGDILAVGMESGPAIWQLCDLGQIIYWKKKGKTRAPHKVVAEN